MDAAASLSADRSLRTACAGRPSLEASGTALGDVRCHIPFTLRGSGTRAGHDWWSLWESSFGGHVSRIVGRNRDEGDCIVARSALPCATAAPNGTATCARPTRGRNPGGEQICRRREVGHPDEVLLVVGQVPGKTGDALRAHPEPPVGDVDVGAAPGSGPPRRRRARGCRGRTARRSLRTPPRGAGGSPC
jgi:hypothetical protein